MCLLERGIGVEEDCYSQEREDPEGQGLHATQDLRHQVENYADMLTKNLSFQHEQCEEFIKELVQVCDCSQRTIARNGSGK